MTLGFAPALSSSATASTLTLADASVTGTAMTLLPGDEATSGVLVRGGESVGAGGIAWEALLQDPAGTETLRLARFDALPVAESAAYEQRNGAPAGTQDGAEG